MDFETFAKTYHREALKHGFELSMEDARKIAEPIFKASTQSRARKVSILDMSVAQYEKLKKMIKQTQLGLIEQIFAPSSENSNVIAGGGTDIVGGNLLLDFRYSFAQARMARGYMEDFLTIPGNEFNLFGKQQVDPQQFFLTVICDGHGGDEAAKWVSKEFPIRLREAARKTTLQQDTNVLEKLLRDTLASLVDEWDNDENNDDSSGCTLLVMILDRVNGAITVLHLGDSRMMLFDDTRRQFIGQTYDHELENPQERKNVEKRFVKATGKPCFVSNYANDIPRVQGNVGMSRAFGDNLPDIMGCLSRTPDITTFELKAPYRYTIILGSDGLFDDLTALELQQLLYNQKLNSKHFSDITKSDIEAIFPQGRMEDASSFVKLLKAKHKADDYLGQDNTTVVIVQTKQRQ